VTFQLLEEITDGFSKERKLGEGAFGVVYRGSTKNGEDVAVKKLRDNAFALDHMQFQNELDNLMKLNHQNIVRLYGYCYQIEQTSMELPDGVKILAEQPHGALCFEFLHNGSLQNHLSDEFSGLDWNTRYKIIKGTCEGLKHIHEELAEPLCHLDIKPDNILLDNNMEPKLADFGLSKIFCDKELTWTAQSSLGTIGYQPPEYIERREISTKFDIFSLGVVMIRIVSGPNGYEKCAYMPSKDFIDQVKMNWRNRLQKTWTGSLLQAYCHQVETCTQIALNCVERDIQKRPDIMKIMDKLNQIEIDIGKHLPNLKMHNKMKMQMEPHDTTDQEQHFSLTTSYSCNEMEFVDIRETSSDAKEEFIVGRTEEKREIVDSLFQSMIQNITILPIYGIGGIGKTTFAKLIYDDAKLSNYSRVWVRVPQRFNLNKVGNSIISQLSGDESQINVTQMIHSRLTELLSGKNVLIVLDDMWEDNPFELNKLKNMLNPGDSNIIVLVTTCNKKVAENISTNIIPHQIEPLTNDMCWEIIKQRSGFEARDDKKQLIDTGKHIAVKCQGVALAAQSIGFMLQSMKPDQWMEVRDNEIWNKSILNDATLPNHVLASLNLSYTKMDPSLKRCFTYCAVFPKGHLIIKEELIHQWISLGLIWPTKLYSSMQLGEKYIVQLLGLSFLQHLVLPLPPKSSLSNKKGLTLFTMHGLVHDLARLLIADKILDATNTGGHGYRYAWLTDCTKPLKSLTDSPAMIMALHFWDCPFKSLEKDAFLQAKSLQVLDLSGCYVVNLPDSIGELVQLRYLNAPRIQSEMLPDSFTKLVELIYLNLGGSDISALPDSIGEIKGLMYLDISGCEFMRRLPESFVSLKSLVYLDLSNNWRMEITVEDFGGLTNNIQHLNLSNNSSFGSNVLEGLQEVISRLTDLRYLDLSGCLWTTQISSLFDCICTLHNLVHLDLSYGWGPIRVPESIGGLKKLHTLDLSGCWNLEMSPECMLKIENIKVLNLTDCHFPRSKCLASWPGFIVDDGESSSNIGFLRHVNPEWLFIQRLEKVRSAKEAHSIHLNKKSEIKFLGLEWTSRDARQFVDDVHVLGELVPPEHLDGFALMGYGSRSFPHWVMHITRYLPLVTKITLWELRGCDRLPPLGQLPNLWRLDVGRMDRVTTIEEEGFCAGPGAFPKLEMFDLREMKNLQVWNTTYSYGQQEEEEEEDAQDFMFPNLRTLRIHDCPKLRLKPCPPITETWEIENSDSVLSSWDEYRGIDLAELLPLSMEVRQKLRQGKIMEVHTDAALRARWDKCRKPGASYSACLEKLEVKFSKLPLQHWRLLHRLLPTYQLTINCCPHLAIASASSQEKEIVQELSYIESLCLEGVYYGSHSQIGDQLICFNTLGLPKWLGELTYLEKLVIQKHRLDVPVEMSMKHLTCLRKLELNYCGSVAALPQWLGELTSLRELTIVNWKDLSSDFPAESTTRRLTSLQEPSLPEITSGPGGIHQTLAESIHQLTGLERLTIKGSEKLAQWCELVENKKKLAHIRDKV